jgi:hypothetical protein
MKTSITKDYVRNLKAPTTDFLCPLQANSEHKIQFLTFRIRTIENKSADNKVLFEIVREAEKDDDLFFDDTYFEEDELRTLRTIKYNFSPEFLNLKTVGTYLEFKVGDKLPVKDFLIIERHYFKGKLLENYEFQFPFCIPGSTNSWEKIYNFPEIDPTTKEAMIKEPWATVSDTFYFVGDDLIMHNKALYSYSPHHDL